MATSYTFTGRIVIRAGESLCNIEKTVEEIIKMGKQKRENTFRNLQQVPLCNSAPLHSFIHLNPKQTLDVQSL